MSDTNSAGRTGTTGKDADAGTDASGSGAHDAAATPAGAPAPTGETPAGDVPSGDVPSGDQLPEMPAEATLVQEGSVPAPRPDRELEEAPKLLQNAAWILLGGALFPFMAAGGGWLSWGVAKLVGLVGCALLGAAVYTRLPQPVPFGLGFLGKVRLSKPKPPQYTEKGKLVKPKGIAAFVQGVTESVPTALHLVGLLFLVVAVALPYFDPTITGPLSQWDPDTGAPRPQVSSFKAAAEVLALLLAGCTLAHIFAYKKGGKFSPLYPFLFLGPFLMGALSIYTQFAVADRKNAIAIIGAATVTIAAGLGVYTIAVAMVQAKKEGDLKRQAAMEARRAARKARSGGKGGGSRSGRS